MAGYTVYFSDEEEKKLRQKAGEVKITKFIKNTMLEYINCEVKINDTNTGTKETTLPEKDKKD